MQETSWQDLREKADHANELTDDSRVSLGGCLTVKYRDLMNGRINHLASRIREYRERKQFETNWRNVPEKLMLVVSELAEAMEVYRYLEIAGDGADAAPTIRGTTDRERAYNLGEEFADAIIRLYDITASLGFDIERCIAEKMAVNEMRPIKHGKTC